MSVKNGILCALLLTCGSAKGQCPAPKMMQPESTDAVSIRFVGDIVLSRQRRYFDDINDYLTSPNILLGNLEGTLTDSGKSRKQFKPGASYAFRASPDLAAHLKESGFDVLNVANNHSYDFYEAGHLATKDSLEQAGIAVAGVKDRLAWLFVRDLNVAVIGFGFYDYQNRIQDLSLAEALVQSAKSQGAHYVVVTFHGGAEGDLAVFHPNQTEQFLGENRGNSVAFARAAIDAGADLVVGHGPHVLRTIECYQGKPIFYSMGNFVPVGGLSVRGNASMSAIGGVSLDEHGNLLGIEVLPVEFNADKTPRPDKNDKSIQLLNRLAENPRYEGEFLRID